MSALETMPRFEERYFCRWLGKMCEEYYKNPENQKRYEAYVKSKKLREQKGVISNERKINNR